MAVIMCSPPLTGQIYSPETGSGLFQVHVQTDPIIEHYSAVRTTKCFCCICINALCVATTMHIIGQIILVVPVGQVIVKYQIKHSYYKTSALSPNIIIMHNFVVKCSAIVVRGVQVLFSLLLFPMYRDKSTSMPLVTASSQKNIVRGHCCIGCICGRSQKHASFGHYLSGKCIAIHCTKVLRFCKQASFQFPALLSPCGLQYPLNSVCCKKALRQPEENSVSETRSSCTEH